MSDGDAAEEIMCATYRALCSHGYADLTMQDIADESPKSKAALHYHYDSKHDLLCAFLDYLYERFVERTADIEAEDPLDELLALVDVVLQKSESEPEAFETALLEIRAQAPYEPGFRERLGRFETYLVEAFVEVLSRGRDDGTFVADVEPEETARFLVTVLTGASTERVTVGHSVESTRRMLRSYVRQHLLAESGALEA
ncbi:TetR/AcrR family transcriptional regulator [Haloarcula salinisoli]|uniref:TetR/AcrR family transcriptional regulator n=1 Tax=Haloarcula salinisoli TaxID=2487746 RepID=A0A8J7YIL4_9EURY|nr:TetR/AcrR family transcriptional regulator [Halomicroarcula salinisoli]MBX0286901.1 TetR/AcrR family transcriptional regulator [Halomicroarcula salinisoli]MBX0304203.1 TetR/AcrR family transcriptional regulator [Halomicroarcula salinisoli]